MKMNNRKPLIEAIIEQRPFSALDSCSPFLQRLKIEFNRISQHSRHEREMLEIAVLGHKIN
jgi:hypothetical protein